MKILAIFLVIGFSSAYAEEIPTCSLLFLNKAKTTVEDHTRGTKFKDKFKHCAISCLLARRCPAHDVREIGILKELADLVGPGNAEWADLEADFKGVDLGIVLKGSTDQACLDSCGSFYPENAPATLNCKN